MKTSISDIAARRRTFRAMHVQGCFVLPNAWDVGGARQLQGLGFKALATTSAGYAWSQGLPEGGFTRDMVLDHLRTTVDATDLPVNADFENGFADSAAGVSENVGLALETGGAGISIEEATSDPTNPIYDVVTAGVCRVSDGRLGALRGAAPCASRETFPRTVASMDGRMQSQAVSSMHSSERGLLPSRTNSAFRSSISPGQVDK